MVDMDIERGIVDAEMLTTEIIRLQSEQDEITQQVKNTIKRLKVPWTRIPNAPVDDCVVLSRRLIKLYNAIQGMSEKEAIEAVQTQINFRTINIVVGGSGTLKQTGEFSQTKDDNA